MAASGEHSASGEQGLKERKEKKGKERKEKEKRDYERRITGVLNNIPKYLHG